MKNLISETLGNGNTITYQIVNGTAYHAETSDKIVEVLEHCRQNKIRVRVYFGDTQTGRDWNEENDVTGYIGRSCGGKINIPLLVFNNRSMGGGALLDHCIVKIKTTSGRVLHVHPTYIAPVITIEKSDLPEYEFNTMVNGELYGRHHSLKNAQNLQKKLA